jgi:ABC-type antimicrobial peptide transport system permease subunit
MLAEFFLFVGGMALFLASIGIYGMIAFNVNRRSRELGIRMALGANTRSIVHYVIRQGFTQIIFGILLGTVLAYGIGMIANRFIHQIDPLDLSVYSSVLLILISVATLAFFVPARKAAKLSPMEAMRYE